MFKSYFSEAIKITDSNRLRDLFSCNNLNITQDGEVCLVGEICIGPGVEFRGKCSIGNGCVIASGSILKNVTLGEKNNLREYSIVMDSCAGSKNILGPFCFIRDNCVIKDNCTLGCHTETTRSYFESGVKVSHRAFIGDATVGANTIIGAGVTFCNWDGKVHQKSSLGSDTTVGSGTSIIAPISIGSNCIIGAGSVVTKNIENFQKIIQRKH